MQISTTMIRPISILLIVYILTSCHGNNNTNDTSQKNNKSGQAPIENIDTTLKLDFFKAIPDTIDGCGEYFTYDTSKVSNDRYIFISNLTDFAIVKINGKDIYLNKDAIESKEIDVKNYISVYRGNGYKAVLTIKLTKNYDEGGFYTGTLEIIGDKIKVTCKVHGQAGC